MPRIQVGTWAEYPTVRLNNARTVGPVAVPVGANLLAFEVIESSLAANEAFKVEVFESSTGSGGPFRLAMFATFDGASVPPPGRPVTRSGLVTFDPSITHVRATLTPLSNRPTIGLRAGFFHEG